MRGQGIEAGAVAAIRARIGAGLGVAWAVLALSAGIALGAPGSPTFVEVERDGVAGVDGLDGASYAGTSPDGRHVYVTGFAEGALAVFARDSSTRRLGFVEAHKDGVAGVDGLGGAAEVTVSPDGRHVYVAARNDDAVAVFARDPSSGALSFVQHLQDNAGGVDGLDGAFALRTSPDGGQLYVAGSVDDAVAAFSRDPATGALSPIEVEKDGVGGVDGLDFAQGLAVSPDGGNIYVSGTDDDAVAVFARDPASGGLSFVQAQRDGVAGVDGLAGAWGVAVSPDAMQVYAVGRDDDAVAAFARDPATGGLTIIEHHRDGGGGVDGLDDAEGVAISPDGANVYVTGHIENALGVFSRNAATGALTFLEFHRDDVGGVDGLGGALGIEAPCDGRSLHVMGDTDDAVAVFSREGGAPGTCAPNLELDAAKQKLDKFVEAAATCGTEACTVAVTGRLKGAGKGLKLKPDADEIAFGEDQPLELRLGRKARRRAKAARQEGKKVFARLTATATDRAGNDASPEAVKIKLR